MNITAMSARSATDIVILSAYAAHSAYYWLAEVKIGMKHKLILLRELLTAVFADVDFLSHSLTFRWGRTAPC